MIYMVCYDITKPKRLGKTAKILEGYGLRIQKSFFQCDMDEARMNTMRLKILSVINTKQDYFFIYPLCEDCSRKAIQEGTGSLIRLECYEIL